MEAAAAEKLAAAEQRRLEREAEEAERKLAEQLELQQRQLQQEIARIRAEVERLRAIDAERARVQERELERRERELEKDREKWERDRKEREEERRRRQNQIANPVPAPAPPGRIRRGAAALAAGAIKAPIPPKPDDRKARPLAPADLDAALDDLASGDPDRELAALKRLGSALADDAQRARVTAAIKPHLDSPEANRAAAATQALAAWADAEHAPQVVKLLESKQTEVRHAAFRTLATFKPKGCAAAIAARLSVPADRNLAADTLTEFGPEGATAAVAHADHEQMWVRSAVIDILEAIGGETSLATLTKLAETDPESFVRNKASDALDHLGT